MEFDEIQIVIIVSSIVLFTILAISITLFVFFQKKKIEFIVREKEQEKNFEKTLASSQIEIRENALKNIAWELHDNVGQLLSIARLELNILQTDVKENNIKKIQEVSELIGESLQDIRSLSKTLNPDVINNMGLLQSIENDINRFNRLNFLKANLKVEGDKRLIPKKDVIILFRILQEFFNNTIKHAKATKLDINIKYGSNKLFICAKDNGKGFDITKIKKGSGLINMKSRADLINTNLKYTSNSKGTKIELTYKNNTPDEK